MNLLKQLEEKKRKLEQKQKNRNTYRTPLTATEWMNALLKKDYVIIVLASISLIIYLKNPENNNPWYTVLPILIIQFIYIHITEQLKRKHKLKED